MDFSRAAVENRRKKALITKMLLVGLPFLAISGLLIWIIKPRRGNAMYQQFFDKPVASCVQMLHHQEQGFDDCSAWMNFTSCPAEVLRILKNIGLQGFKRVDSTGSYADCSEQQPGWWLPSDRMFKLRYRHSEKMWTIDFYITTDSTQVFCQSFSY